MQGSEELALLTGLMQRAWEPQSLAAFWNSRNSRDANAWLESPELYQSLGKFLLDKEEPIWAYDVLTEGLRLFPVDLLLRQRTALSLARAGAPASARDILAKLRAEGHNDPETLGLWARTHKDLAEETTDLDRKQAHWGAAFSIYREAYETACENKASAVKTITPMLDKDGSWRISGYYIK